MIYMEYRNLGGTNIKVSVLCLGTWEFAQNESWGPGDLRRYREVIDYALDMGINFIDTAEGYGKSEEILGELLEGRRDDVVLATKMSRVRSGFGYENMRKSLERSLNRLKTDFIDLYQIHWPKIRGHWSGGERGMEAEDYEDIYDSLRRFKDEGLIGAGGVSNFRLHHLRNFRDEAFNLIVTDQIPLNLLWREYDKPEMLEFCRERGLRYLAYSSLAQGLLTGRYSRESSLTEIQRVNVLFNEPIYSRAMKVLDVVKEVAAEVDATPSQVALRWVLSHDLVVSAIVGTRNPDHLRENIEAVDLKLSRDQLDRLDEASREFWKPMPSGVELWLHDNTRENLRRMGIQTDKGYEV